MQKEVVNQLRQYAATYENSDFLTGDPSWFMHQTADKANQELIAFVASCLSYGNRRLFMPKIAQLCTWAEGDFYTWITSKSYRDHLADNDMTFYRLQTNSHMRHLLDALAALLQAHRSIGDYCEKQGATTAMEALDILTRYFAPWNVGHLVPRSTASSCKRLCMFLRWMVRKDSPVDLGLWNFIASTTLLIPLDTHVLQEARRLRLISSKSASMRTVKELTARLLEIFPDDPMKGDFALFGYGILKNEK